MTDRRSFLKRIGLTGTLFAAPATLIDTIASPKRESIDLSNIRLKGQVHVNGKGLAGVAVTDGLNVTLTGKNGTYELLSNNTAEFVYISLPRGYEIPNINGVARFYSPIKRNGSVFNADFALERLNQDDSNHNFVVWADPQIRTKEDAEQLKTQSAPDLRDLVKSYPAGTLFHGIGCGDLVWDKFELFEDYKEALHISSIPFFNVIGNHDMDIEQIRSDEFSSQTFKQQFGPTYYSFNRGEIHYVVLDDVFFIGAEKKYIGYLTEMQLQWLEQDLKYVKKGSTIVVSLHIPSNTGTKRRNKLKEDELGGVVSNRQRLFQILDGYKVHIMSGHTHMNEKWEDGNIMEHVHGTVCGAWWTGPICSDGCPRGYGVYEVKGSELSWYHKSTGKPVSHQITIHPKGSVKGAPDEIVANVWNWDPKWEIRWYEDGVLKGEMEQRISLDPVAEKLYSGAELPKKRTFVEPTLTDHLFYAKCSPGAKVIKVEAKDRFGKVYSEQITV